MGSAAPAIATETEPEPKPYTPPPLAGIPELRTAVLNAISASGQIMLNSMLDAGEWQVEGNELTIKVSPSATVVDMTLGADAKKLIVATASGVLGRPVKLKVIAEAAVSNERPEATRSVEGGGRNRAENDPVVRKMKELFGAEIRTIIDYRERR